MKVQLLVLLVLLPLMLLSKSANHQAKDRSMRIHNIYQEILQQDSVEFIFFDNYEVVYSDSSSDKIDRLITTSGIIDHAEFAVPYNLIFNYNNTFGYMSGIDDDGDYNGPRYAYEYDNQGRLIRDFQYAREDSISIYPHYIHEYLYNNNRLTTKYGSNNDFAGTLLWDRFNYIRDPQGRVITVLRYVSSDSLNWSTDSKYDITYYPDYTSNAVDEVQVLRDYWISTFSLYDISSSLYGKVNEMTYRKWTGTIWKSLFKYVYTYDDNVNLISIESTAYYENSWHPDSEELYTYDANGNLIQKTFRFWDLNNEQWDYLDTRLTITWEQFTANEDETVTPVTSNLIAYPNPFGDELSLKLESQTPGKAEIKIYNIKGQLIKTSTVIAKRGENVFNWDGKDSHGKAAPVGMYLIKVRNGGNSRTLKCLKVE